MTADLTAWLAALDGDAREGVDRLRNIVRSVDAPWTETIKWNAPSFAVLGEDRVTLGLNRRGGFRVVLHCGARKSDVSPDFQDPKNLAVWPTPDRGVVQFPDKAALEASADELRTLIEAWVRANLAKPG